MTDRQWAALARAVFRYPLLVALIPMVVAFHLATGQFLTGPNLRGIAMDSAVLLVVAVPGALLLISGYLDLSVGSTIALGAVTAATLLIDHGTTAGTAIVAAILAGGLVGLVNGWLCCYANLSPFIVTLGTLTAIRGLDLLISPLPRSGFGDSFGYLGSGQLLGVPVPIVVAVVVFGVGAAFLGLTPAGRYVYAIGVNREAAYLSGLAVRRVPLLLYVAAGAAAGLAGTIQAARLNSAPAGSLGLGFELTVLTAVLLGGVAFSGGSGTVPGVLLGVLFLGALQNGLTQLNVPDAWQDVARGLALVGAAALALVRLPASLSRRLLPAGPATATPERAEPPGGGGPGSETAPQHDTVPESDSEPERSVANP